jgi:general secretion pathway protein D
MTPEDFYQSFLVILQLHGWVAVRAGDTIKVLPDANAL